MNGEDSFDQQISVEYLLGGQYCARDMAVTRTASARASIIIQPSGGDRSVPRHAELGGGSCRGLGRD